MFVRTPWISVACLLIATGAAACGSSDDTGSATPAAASTPSAATAGPADPSTSAPSTAPASRDADARTTDPTATSEGATEELDPDAPDLGRVVALAEEPLLADLLALGIRPIASSASVDTVGFQGLGDVDTGGIEVLPMTTLSLEYLASLRPDTIITTQFWLDQVGAATLEGMATVIAEPDGLYGAERLTELGELVGRPEHATAVGAEFDAAVAEAQDAVGGDCVVSLAAVYPGPSVAAFVAGPWEIPSSILATGCRLDPSAADATPDQNGRVFLSPEQFGLLDSEQLVLVQSDTVEGEPEALAEIEANPIWQTLPAVDAGNVARFDRLGYAGATGQIRFLEEFSALVAPA